MVPIEVRFTSVDRLLSLGVGDVVIALAVIAEVLITGLLRADLVGLSLIQVERRPRSKQKLRINVCCRDRLEQYNQRAAAAARDGYVNASVTRE
jgi:hypothetical protein